jgi:hypothetical protein
VLARPGAGSFSTSTFLDRNLFPSAERALSFETAPEWNQRVEARAGGDEHLTVTLVEADVPRAAAGCDFSTFDRVFVDNGQSEPVRAKTIKKTRRQSFRDVVPHVVQSPLVRVKPANASVALRATANAPASAAHLARKSSKFTRLSLDSVAAKD